LAWLSLVGKAYYDVPSGRWKTGCILKTSDIYVPSPVLKGSEAPINMERLLRFLDTHTYREASPFLKISKMLPGQDSPSLRKNSPVRKITLGDRTMSLGQWAKETGLSFSTLAGRFDSGWPPERILNEPCHVDKQHSIAKQLAQEPHKKHKPNRKITLGDRTMSIGQWARKTGLSPSTISGRLNMGWLPERILGEPCHARPPAQMPLVFSAKDDARETADPRTDVPVTSR
jgi:lambda repressor-like predicted transcriptional regulator